MHNPFSETAGSSDEVLLSLAQDGNREAQETLLVRHQPWVFNLAVRMLFRRPDAEDATQDILLAALHALPGFHGECPFRTWLYRIAVDRILDRKVDRWTAAGPICSFHDAAIGLQRTPDLDLPDPGTVPVPLDALVEEAKTACTSGMLLCLEGRQRLVFILGEVFGASDEVGGEIAGMAPADFRQLLAHARESLYQYLRGHCGVVNPAQPCRCARKTRAFIQGGLVDPEKLLFTADHRHKVRAVAPGRAGELTDTFMQAGAAVYRDHPFYDAAAQVERLRVALKNEPPE